MTWYVTTANRIVGSPGGRPSPPREVQRAAQIASAQRVSLAAVGRAVLRRWTDHHALGVTSARIERV